MYTNVYDPARISEPIRRHRVRTTFVNRLPFARRLFEKYLPLLPIALEQIDLRDYDLVISHESAPAKGVIVPLGALHVCYCSSPMRYAWDMYPDYLEGVGPVVRALMRPLLHYLRFWDRVSADRVDAFIANSRHTRRRIRKYYRRDAVVIAPPAETAAFAPRADRGDFYLVVGQLTRYKRVDLAVAACARLGRPLVVIGQGAEMARLKRLAGAADVTFLGWQPDDAVREHYARCRALLFPGEEDFGIVPVEAMASGRPVIAYASGGALDTVVDGATGVLFHEQTPDALAGAIERYEAIEPALSPAHLVAHARAFGRDRFEAEVRAEIDRLWRAHRAAEADDLAPIARG